MNEQCHICDGIHKKGPFHAHAVAFSTLELAIDLNIGTVFLTSS